MVTNGALYNPDEGKPRTNQAVVEITVLDVNDVDPKFDYPEYFATIPECVAQAAWPDDYKAFNDKTCRLAGQALTLKPAALAGTDGDQAGTNAAKLVFELDSDAGSNFKADKLGNIVVAGGFENIDRESVTELVFTAIVRDNNGETSTTKVDKAKITVRITGPSISNLNIAPLFLKMAQNLDLRCVLISDPSTLGAGAKTRLESRIKKFTPHCVCRPQRSRTNPG